MDRFVAYKTFISVVESGSLIKAARELNLSPSAVSKQLSQLEHEIGASLITRSTRKITVSSIGLSFAQECRSILRQAEEIEERLRTETQRPTGRLRITWPQIMMRGPLIKMMTDFSRAYPGIKVENLVSNVKLDMIKEHIDFSFRTLQQDEFVASSIPLFPSRSVLCGSPEFLDRVGVPDNLQELLSHGILLPSFLNLSDFRNLLSAYGSYKNLDHYHSFDDAIAYYEAVKSGMGFGLAQFHLIQRDLKEGSLVEVLKGFKLHDIMIHLIDGPNISNSPKHILFKEFVQRYFEK